MLDLVDFAVRAGTGHCSSEDFQSRFAEEQLQSCFVLSARSWPVAGSGATAAAIDDSDEQEQSGPPGQCPEAARWKPSPDGQQEGGADFPRRQLGQRRLGELHGRVEVRKKVARWLYGRPKRDEGLCGDVLVTKSRGEAHWPSGARRQWTPQVFASRGRVAEDRIHGRRDVHARGDGRGAGRLLDISVDIQVA